MQIVNSVCSRLPGQLHSQYARYMNCVFLNAFLQNLRSIAATHCFKGAQSCCTAASTAMSNLLPRPTCIQSLADYPDTDTLALLPLVKRQVLACVGTLASPNLEIFFVYSQLYCWGHLNCTYSTSTFSNVMEPGNLPALWQVCSSFPVIHRHSHTSFVT